MIVNTGLRRFVGNTGLGGARRTSTFLLDSNTSLIAGHSAGSPTPTTTRATVATVTDFEGRLVTVPSGAMRNQGGRFVSNLCPTASTTISVAGNKTITVGVGTFVFSMGAEATGTSLITFTGTATGSTGTLTANATNRTSKTLTVTVGGTIIATCTVAAANNIQFEDVTGQSNQNPSEYVSVGVLSAPYHGWGADGCKWFDYENGNTVASNVVSEAAGPAINQANSKFAVAGTVVGDCYTTPAAAANQIAGTFDTDVWLAMASWSGSTGTIVAKDVSGNRQFRLAISSGISVMEVMDTAGNVLTFNASAAVSFANGTQGGVRVLITWALAGNCLANFYTSTDGGVTWTALGTQQTQAATGNAIKASSQPVYIAQRQFGGAESHLSAASIYRLRVYAGDRSAGTLAVNFNANDFSSGSTWPASTTGETWTINGNARVFGGSGAASIAAPWTANGPMGFLSEPAGTNLCLQSQTFDVTGAGGYTYEEASITANSITAPDGTLTADTVVETTGNSWHGFYATTRILGSPIQYTASIWLKAGTRTWAYIRKTGGVDDYVWFNLATGVVGTQTNATGTIKAYPNGWYRCTATFTTSVAGDLLVSAAEADNDTVYTATNGNAAIYAWGFQCEANAVASSYIATTTAAVTRNADIDSYVTSGNLPASGAFVIAGEFTPNTSDLTISKNYWGTYSNGNNWTAVYFTPTGNLLRFQCFIGGVAGDAEIAFSPVAGTTYKWSVRYSPVTGRDVWLNGTKGTNNATLTQPVFGSTIELGSLNSATQPYAALANTTIYAADLSDSQCAALSS